MIIYSPAVVKAGSDLKPYWIIGIAGISIVISGIAGFINGTPAALVGGFVFPFAIFFALTYYFLDVRPKRNLQGEPDDTIKSSTDRINTPHPEETISGEEEEFLKENDIVREYMESFGISRDKAQNLYDAGYSRWTDFSEAIPEDLVMVEGINPTISRRIISRVRSRK